MTDDREAVEIVARWFAKDAGHDPDRPVEHLGNVPTWTLYAQNAADLLGMIRAAGRVVEKVPRGLGLFDALRQQRDASIASAEAARAEAARAEAARAEAFEEAAEVARRAVEDARELLKAGEVSLEAGGLAVLTAQEVERGIRARAALANVTADRSDAP